MPNPYPELTWLPTSRHLGTRVPAPVLPHGEIVWGWMEPWRRAESLEPRWLGNVMLVKADGGIIGEQLNGMVPLLLMEFASFGWTSCSRSSPRPKLLAPSHDDLAGENPAKFSHFWQRHPRSSWVSSGKGRRRSLLLVQHSQL